MVLKHSVLVTMMLINGLLVDVSGPCYSYAHQEWKTYVDPVNKFSIDYPPTGSAPVNVESNQSRFKETSISLSTNYSHSK